MIYPGNTDLSPEAQERVLSTFTKVVGNLQAGRRDDAVVGLDFVLRLDPEFRPAVALQRQLEAGATDIDLGTIVADLQSRSETDINASLVEAVDLFNDRRFLEAKEVVEQALLELPGHQEARQLLKQIQDALKTESRVADYLSQAHGALEAGDAEGSANFVLMAQTLDPHHPGIAQALRDLEARGVAPGPTPAATPDENASGPQDTFEFSFDEGAESAGSDRRELQFEEPAGDEAGTEGGSSPGELSFGEGDELGGESPMFSQESGDIEPGGDELTFEPAPTFGEDLGADSSVSPEELIGPGAEDEEIEALLQEGQKAFDEENYQEAINAWSKIYLVDPSSDAAGEKIDLARRRLEESAEELDVLYHTAADAAEEGRADEALRTLETVLDRKPDHLAARDLRERLQHEPPPPGGAARSLEEDTAPESATDAPAADADTGEPTDIDILPEPEETGVEMPELPSIPEEDLGPGPSRRSGPLRLVLLALGAMVVVGLAAWIGLKLFAGGPGEPQPQVVQQALREAQQLFEQHRIQEAIHLLEGVEASELDQVRIERRLARYRQALTPPTPTPVPQKVARAAAFLEEGRVIAAYRLVREELLERPEDTGLLELQDKIRAREPLVSSLDRAIDRDDPATALSIARQIVEQHPESPEAQQEMERWLFNSARAELKEYNFTGAQVLLEELARRRPDDSEVRRVLEFIQTYKRRSVDMQLKIFINSLDKR